jgi:hypothetical protein
MKWRRDVADLRANGNTSDITPNSAVMEMARLSRQLDELGFRLKAAEREAVTTEHRYRVEKAKALLACQDGTVPEREAQALLATESVRLAAKLAAAELSILRREISIAETRIDVGRSVVGVLRMEASLAR